MERLLEPPATAYHLPAVPTALDLSNFAGLGAIGLLTINILLGLLLSVKYNPVRSWPHRRIDTQALHNWTGYTALAVSLVHPVLILFSATAKFGVRDIVFPVDAPKQPLVNTFGALALYCLIVVVATSWLWDSRGAMSRRLWKRFHYVTYAMFPLYAVHALLTDPALQDHPVDWLDAEKVFVELCVLVVAVAIAFRVRYALRREKERGAEKERLAA